ncbi:MAG: 4Fe-4S dicluster domain-containing protein [Candidatus Hydrogenedentes bacterium]|nr:4Fe-4S dicluster domain-containing protein [Candidatus Hydrogenedentota bacterium]
MPQVGWTFDAGRCIGCRSCFVACKAENSTPLRTDWRFVVERTTGRFPTPKREFISLACNHCDEPACIKSCPVDAISKRASDGVVLIDQEKCVGCRYCVAACPYGAPRVDTDTNKVSKCTMCVHRLDAGLLPACALACVTGAIQFVPDYAGETGQVPEGFSDPRLTRPNIEFVLAP